MKKKQLGKPDSAKAKPDANVEDSKPVMKISEVMDLKYSLETFQKKSGVKGWKIGICVLDNLEDIRRSLAAVEKYEKDLLVPLEPFSEAKNELIIKHSIVDGQVQTDFKDGNAIPKIQNMEAYRVDFEALKEKHKVIVEEYDKKHEEHLKNIEETDSNFKITYISRAVVEKEAPEIDQRFLSLIYPILEPRK